MMTPGNDSVKADSEAACIPGPLPASMISASFSFIVVDSESKTMVCISVFTLEIAISGSFPSAGCC